MRAPACSAHMPALAIGDGRWRGSWQSGTARCSRCGSATPSVWPLLPMRCTRSWRNSRSLTVELRVGGFAAWRTPEWGAPRDAYQRIRGAYEDNVRLGMLVGASETLGYATEALFLAGDLDGAQRQLDEALADRRQAGRARVSAAALPHGGCDRSFAWRAHGCRRLGSTRDRGGQSAGGTVAGVDGAD